MRLRVYLQLCQGHTANGCQARRKMAGTILSPDSLQTRLCLSFFLNNSSFRKPVFICNLWLLFLEIKGSQTEVSSDVIVLCLNVRLLHLCKDYSLTVHAPAHSRNTLPLSPHICGELRPPLTHS